jgi:hypothetical protein
MTLLVILRIISHNFLRSICHCDLEIILRGDSREALLSSYVTIAGLLKLSQADGRDQMLVVEAVKRWLLQFGAAPINPLVRECQSRLCIHCHDRFRCASPFAGRIPLVSDAPQAGSVIRVNSRRCWMSRTGGSPKWRLYSRLKCEASS